MNKAELKKALCDIGLALNASHNTVATDIVGVEPTETSWRVNHEHEIAILQKIEEAIFSRDTCPVCGGRNTCL